MAPSGQRPRSAPPLVELLQSLRSRGGEQPGRLTAAEPSHVADQVLTGLLPSKGTSRPRSARGRRYPTQARSTSPLTLCEAALSLLVERAGALGAILRRPSFTAGAGMPGRSRCRSHLLASLPYLDLGL